MSDEKTSPAETPAPEASEAESAAPLVWRTYPILGYDWLMQVKLHIQALGYPELQIAGRAVGGSESAWEEYLSALPITFSGSPAREAVEAVVRHAEQCAIAAREGLPEPPHPESVTPNAIGTLAEGAASRILADPSTYAESLPRFVQNGWLSPSEVAEAIAAETARKAAK